jgi:hypothetical protein
MNLMTDAVARPRMINSALCSYRLQIQMVVMVLRPEAGHIVVNVAYRQIGFNLSRPQPRLATGVAGACPHRLVQQKRRRPRGVLRKRLVNTNPNLPAGGKLALYKVTAKYLINECLSQFCTP